MKRTYTREEYLEKIGLIRGARRPISITTDFIVGFPGETDEDFEETLSLLDVAQFDGTFSFQYSPRPHTEAALMADPVPESEKQRRLQALLERQRGIQVQRNQSLVGQTFEVLVEGATRKEIAVDGSHIEQPSSKFYFVAHRPFGRIRTSSRNGCWSQ